MGAVLKTLAGALARLTTDEQGLQAIYLPELLDDLAEQVVRAANELRRLDAGGQPFAVLVDESRQPDETDTACRRVSMGGLIKYRTGSRLAVVAGPHSVPASIAGSFVKIPVAGDFPGGPSGRDDRLGVLAERAIEALLYPYTDAGGFMNQGLASARLGSVMTTLATAYESLAQGAAPWNVYWFRHVGSGLRVLADCLAANGGADDLDHLLESSTFAAFGLPAPAVGLRYGHGHALAEALVAHWGSTDAVQLSLDQLLMHPSRPEEEQGQQHPVARLGFEDYDARIAATDNVLLAWGTLHASSAALPAYHALTESQFFAPDQNLDSALIISSAAGGPLGFDQESSAGPAFVVFDEDDGTLRSEKLKVLIPTPFLPEGLDIARSGLAIDLAGKGGYWSGTLGIEDGQLVAIGVLSLKCPSKKRMVKKPVVLSASVPPNDVLAGLVGKPASPPIYPIVADGVGIWSFDVNKQGEYKSGVYRGYENVVDCLADPGTEIPVDAPIGTTVRVVSWCPVGQVSPSDTRHIRTDQARLRVDVTNPDMLTTGENEYVVGNLTVRWSGGQPAAEYLSPLLAAAQGGALSAGEPDQRLVESLRGRIESFLTESIDAELVTTAHGHMAMFADSSEVPDMFEQAAGGAVLALPGSAARLSSATNFSVSEGLRASPEAQRFRDALRSLHLAEYMTVRGRTNEGPSLVWPSRTSWEDLHGTVELAEYLEAYTSLMERASSGSSRDQFWAAFPFSLAVYGHGSAEARAVLLTPLHPLRLAWLAGAEAALRRGPHSRNLAGILEGWNLPMVGPQPNSQNGRVIAVPIDAGSGQLFLGWSMMVWVSVAGPHALKPPARIGGLAAPGSSVTGLNSDAVTSALRTFHRMNPHVATLSIDLASSAPGARLDEIDDAVIDAILRPDQTALRGGVRVHDSMNRIGDAPIEELERRLAPGQQRRPVRWSRYRGSVGAAPRSNLRFLQDAGLKVEVSQTATSGAGLLGSVPIRRLSVPVAAQTNGSGALTYPGVELNSTSTAYQRALAQVERLPQGVQLSVELFRAALVDEGADWTVTGESLLGSSALADLLATDANGQMLWEWRPPFLSARGAARLDARPFVSVVRMPRAFKAQVARAVARAAGKLEMSADDPAVGEVMSTLGARGIGLSTLMAHGGTHAAGAMGFYVGLRLAELTAIDDYQLLVLPIDACDEFLRALAGETASANQLRRADLLVLAVRPGEAVLIPVEIKCYGLDSSQPPAHLPSSSGQLTEPLEQLESTAALIQQLINEYRTLGSAEPEVAALWRHGFATMIEAAIRLHPGPVAAHEDLLRVLSGILDGTALLRSGRSLIAYFASEATGPDGELHLVLPGLTPPNDPTLIEVQALVANTQAAFQDVHSGAGAIVESWNKLLRWAVYPTDQDAVEGTARPETAVQPTDVSTANPSDAQTPDGFAPPSSGPRVEEDLAVAGSNVAAPEAAPAGPPESMSVLVAGEQGPESGFIDEQSANGPDRIIGDGVKLSIGHTLDGVSKSVVNFWPSNTALNQMNIGVIGDLGTGKTQFLKALVRQLRHQAASQQPTPVSMLIFDYKRDYQDESFLDDVGGTLLRPFHIPLDVLAISGSYSPQKAVQSASAFIDIISKIYSGIGPIQRNNLLVVIKQLFEDRGGDAPTLGEIVGAYEAANGIDSVVAVLNSFVLNEVFAEDRSRLVPMEELLDDKVLVLAVSDLGSDEKLKTALITLFLNKYYEYMLRLKKWPYEGEAPNQLRRLNSFVLVDEATNIMKHEFPVLSQLLLQGREFGVGVILASQYLSHFKVGQTKYGEALLTKVIHKVPDAKVNDLKAFGISTATQSTADRIPLLQVHQALCKTLGVEGRFMRGIPYFELTGND